jgi:hypothetical protein
VASANSSSRGLLMYLPGLGNGSSVTATETLPAGFTTALLSVGVMRTIKTYQKLSASVPAFPLADASESKLCSSRLPNRSWGRVAGCDRKEGIP